MPFTRVSRRRIAPARSISSTGNSSSSGDHCDGGEGEGRIGASSGGGSAETGDGESLREIPGGFRRARETRAAQAEASLGVPSGVCASWSTPRPPTWALPHSTRYRPVLTSSSPTIAVSQYPHQRILPAPARGLVHADGHEATHQWVRVRVILPNRHRRVGLPGADAPGPADNAREGEVTNSPSPGTFRNNESARRARPMREVWPAPVSRRCVQTSQGFVRPARKTRKLFPRAASGVTRGARPAIVDAARRTSDGDGDRGDPVLTWTFTRRTSVDW